MDNVRHSDDGPPPELKTLEELTEEWDEQMERMPAPRRRRHATIAHSPVADYLFARSPDLAHGTIFAVPSRRSRCGAQRSRAPRRPARRSRSRSAARRGATRAGPGEPDEDEPHPYGGAA